MPLRESGEVVFDSLGIGPEIMGTIPVGENPCLVFAVERITSQVIASVHHHAPPPRRSETFGDHQPGKAGADDQEIRCMVCLQGDRGSSGNGAARENDGEQIQIDGMVLADEFQQDFHTLRRGCDFDYGAPHPLEWSGCDLHFISNFQGR